RCTVGRSRNRANRAGSQMPVIEPRSAKTLALVRRGQEEHSALGHICRGAVKQMERAARVNESAHPAASACAGLFSSRRGLSRERLAVIGRARKPDAAMLFAFLFAGPMPGDINIAVFIRRQRSAAVERVADLHQVTLGFEGGLCVVHPRVEHRGGIIRSPRRGLVRSVPGDMNAPLLADGDVRATYRASRYGASRLAVDP